MDTQARHVSEGPSGLCCPPPPVLSLNRALMCTGQGTSTLHPLLMRTRVEMCPPVVTCTRVQSTPSALCWCAEGWRTIPSSVL